MLSLLIKYFIIINCCFYFVKKLTKKQTLLHVQILFSCVITFLSYFVLKYVSILFIPFLIVTTYFYIKYTFYLSAKLNLTVICISITLNYSCYVLSTALIIPLYYPLTWIISTEHIRIFLLLLLTGIIQILLSMAAFKIKRFKSGMPFLSQRTCNDTGLIISIFALIITTLYYAFPKPNILFFILVFISILLCLIIVIWWRHNLNKAYWDAVNKNQIAALETEIVNLKRDNDNLSKVIHKDNKLIPAMVLAVTELLNTSIKLDEPELNAKAAKLLDELEIISKERKGILAITEKHLYELPKSNLMRLDSLISYLYQRCILFQIQFQVLFHVHINELLEFISERELDTIIADLLENAIYATKNQENKKILFCIDSKDNVFFIDVYDTGIPFKPEIIHKLGKSKATSHADDGGSGIGLYNTISVCKKYSFSFIIEESPQMEDFTKKISIIFDDKSMFLYNGILMDSR